MGSVLQYIGTPTHVSSYWPLRCMATVAARAEPRVRPGQRVQTATPVATAALPWHP